MNSDKLENLKREYLKTETPSYLHLHGWDDISQKLSQAEEKRFSTRPAFALAFAVVVLLAFTSTLVFASQPSKPGDNLYQVKILSDKVYSEITGDYQTAIDKRAQEVIELKDEPNGRFDQAAEEYQQALDEAKDKTKGSDENKKEQLRQKLEDKEKEFEGLSKENTKNQNKLQDVADQTRRTRGEVKGEKDNSGEENDGFKEEEEKGNTNRGKESDD